MVVHACQEISTGELEAYRSCGAVDSGQAVTTLAIRTVETEQGCIQLHQNLSSDYTDELLDALAWSTGVKDRGMLVSLAGDLHEVLRDEQIRKHARATLQEPQTDTAEPKPLLVHPHKLASRMQAAKLYHEQLLSCGWRQTERESLGARGVSSWSMCSGRIHYHCDAGHWRWEGGCVRMWKRTTRTAESHVFGTAKMLGGADLGMSAAELQAEEGRGCARVCGRACSSGGRGSDSQLIGNA